jgi:hypothetical protein
VSADARDVTEAQGNQKEPFMASSKADLIRLLEAELDLIEGGGYGRRAGQPTEDTPPFYHSIVCINHWLVPGRDVECCEGCILLDAVPDEHKREEKPCHLIRLNAAGETVKSLQAAGDRERLELEVKNWLRATIKRFKEDEKALGLADVAY